MVISNRPPWLQSISLKTGKRNKHLSVMSTEKSNLIDTLVCINGGHVSMVPEALQSALKIGNM